MLRRKLKKTDENLFIQDGQPVLADRQEERIEWQHICIRIPKKLHTMISQILKGTRIGMTMNAYVIEAILEKTMKDQNPV